MKENKYDDKSFFEKYSQMSRSKEGLISAGEWETLKALLPSFEDKALLDLGCGYGWHCIYAVEQGAKAVVGVDISTKMLEVAKTKTSSDKVEYICSAMEDISFQNDSFDIVLSSLALHYVKDYDVIVKKTHSILKKGGTFIFSVEHPIFTSYGTQDWIYDEKGQILHFPVDRYFFENEREANFLGEKVVKFHRTMTTYLNTLLENGFKINAIVEPQPTKQMLENISEMKDELRRPMMLIVSAEKL